jgi:hypothetical protein
LSFCQKRVTGFPLSRSVPTGRQTPVYTPARSDLCEGRYPSSLAAHPIAPALDTKDNQCSFCPTDERDLRAHEPGRSPLGVPSRSVSSAPPPFCLEVYESKRKPPERLTSKVIGRSHLFSKNLLIACSHGKSFSVFERRGTATLAAPPPWQSPLLGTLL